jgi:hypothetical protein
VVSASAQNAFLILRRVPGDGWRDAETEEREMGRSVRYSRFGAVLVLLLTGAAPAQELDSAHELDELDSCAGTCRSESGAADCQFDAQQAKQLCLQEHGCDALRGAYSGACLGKNRDEAACNEARGKLRDCVAPCHEGFSARLGVCMELMDTCLREQCGIELPESGPGLRFRVFPETPVPEPPP